jgi:PQQ-dependent catabolism-associated beta-propeller protein
LETLASLPTVADPKTFAISPDGKYLFASDDDHQQIHVIDLAHKTIIKDIPCGQEPEGVSVSPDGRWVISTSEASHQASWIDAQNLRTVDKTLVGARPRYSRFTDDGKQLWVTSEAAGSLSIIDTQTRQIVKSLQFQIPNVPADEIKPVGIRIDRQRRLGYVALGRANRVAVVDAQSWAVVDYIEVGKRVWNIEFSPDQTRLYAVNGLSDDLSIVDLSIRKTVKTVPLGKAPWGIAVAP